MRILSSRLGFLWRMRRSLGTRVVIAVVVAFGLVGAVLLVRSYIEFKQGMATNSGLQQLARGMAASLNTVHDAHGAAMVLAGTEAHVAATRAQASVQLGTTLGPLLYQLWDQQGRLIYATPRLGRRELRGEPGRVVDRVLDGTTYWVVQAELPQGSLRLAEPRINDATALSWMGSDLLPSLLLAFPLVVLPVWLAVRQGLKPLRRLSERLAARAPDDLAPLGVDLKYSELNTVTTAFDQLLERLRDKLARERAFVQDAAHELRTPMAVISAQAHVLAQAASAAERQQAEHELDQAIARASHLAQQLLTLAALDEARHSPPQRIDVAELLRATLARSVGAAMARNIELSLDAPDQLLWTLDLPAFQSVLNNLLDNALRYVHDGAQVSLSLGATGEQLTLTVADNGPGIPAAEQATIFDRFVRGSVSSHASDGRQVSGSGLGLAIVQQAVRAMGGQVLLQAGPLRGACFVVTLPTCH